VNKNMVEGETYVCKRCGHVWIGRKDTLPRVCPKCKSPYWNRNRILKMPKEWYKKHGSRIRERS
jgi:predicted Zn-ribbon and HTH transcriptional regulator